MKARESGRLRAERRLGWTLCAPAVIVMIAVAGFAIGYWIYLSFVRYLLSSNTPHSFVGLSNYGAMNIGFATRIRAEGAHAGDEGDEGDELLEAAGAGVARPRFAPSGTIALRPCACLRIVAQGGRNITESG